MGIVSEIVPVFSRRPIFGYRAVVRATVAIACLTFLGWGEHMFTAGLPTWFNVDLHAHGARARRADRA